MEIAVEIRNLKKYYGDIKAVDDISLEIPKGMPFGFLGPNGAGKSTTISMLSTVIPLSSGEAKILSFDLKEESKKNRKHINICP